MFTNSQILAAVINQWLQPLVESLVTSKVGNLPMLGAAENWIKNLGVVSPKYSIVKDLMPIISGASGVIVIPVLSKYFSMVDDASLPAMAHGIIDKAIENGELSLAEGFLVFEEEDLKRLKRLLDLNLPLSSDDGYVVKTD